MHSTNVSKKKQISSRKGQQEDGTEAVLMYEKNF